MPACKVVGNRDPDIESSFGRPLSQRSAGVRGYQRGKAPENIAENMHADVMLDYQFVVNTPVTTPSTVRGPHVDKPYKLFAALLYFRLPDDRSVGGNLVLERAATRRCRFDRRQQIPEEFAEPIAEIPYAPNSLAECYTVRPEGLFQLDRTFPGLAYWIVKRWIRSRAMRSTLTRT